MGHTKPELIADLATELATIRSLPFIKEKKTGVFYFKSTPFLHFHDKDGTRWAHLKELSGDWKKVDVPFDASASTKSRFLKVIKTAHKIMTSKQGSPKAQLREKS